LLEPCGRLCGIAGYDLAPPDDVLIVYAYPVELAGAAINQIVLTIGSLDPVVSGAA